MKKPLKENEKKLSNSEEPKKKIQEEPEKAGVKQFWKIGLRKSPLARKKKAKKRRKRAKKIFGELIEKSGMNITPEKMLGIIYNSSIIITMLISVYLLYFFSVNEGYGILYTLITIIPLWTIGFAAIMFLLGFITFMVIDLAIYNRKIGVEDVFPDFLQLTSANIRAGMPIDQALWHAIRPNFGVLAKEMEDVAKQTMAGTDLEDALVKFSNRYDSKLIQRSISLLIEGLNAGGEIGELLDRISTNIMESKTMQKEMSASVTTYAIFISFASIVAAPFLLALSNQLLSIIGNIISNISVSETSSAQIISFSEIGVQSSDFMIFALTTLTITSILSASIVATIKKGNIKAGMKYLPFFVLASISIFLILNFALGFLLVDIF